MYFNSSTAGQPGSTKPRECCFRTGSVASKPADPSSAQASSCCSRLLSKLSIPLCFFPAFLLSLFVAKLFSILRMSASALSSWPVLTPPFPPPHADTARCYEKPGIRCDGPATTVLLPGPSLTEGFPATNPSLRLLEFDSSTFGASQSLAFRLALLWGFGGGGCAI